MAFFKLRRKETPKALEEVQEQMMDEFHKAASDGDVEHLQKILKQAVSSEKLFTIIRGD